MRDSLAALHRKGVAITAEVTSARAASFSDHHAAHAPVTSTRRTAKYETLFASEIDLPTYRAGIGHPRVEQKAREPPTKHIHA